MDWITILLKLKNAENALLEIRITNFIAIFTLNLTEINAQFARDTIISHQIAGRLIFQ